MSSGMRDGDSSGRTGVVGDDIESRYQGQIDVCILQNRLVENTHRKCYVDILQNRLVENTRRKCYVDGVNLAAKHATGDILIVNADDQYPCPHSDIVPQSIHPRPNDRPCPCPLRRLGAHRHTRRIQSPHDAHADPLPPPLSRSRLCLLSGLRVHIRRQRFL